MKTFTDYLDERNETPNSFAVRNELSNATVWRAYNKKPMSGKNALKIHKATGKRVPITALIDPTLSGAAREACPEHGL